MRATGALHGSGVISSSNCASLIRTNLAFGSGVLASSGLLRFRPRFPLAVVASSSFGVALATFLASFVAFLAFFSAFLVSFVAFFVARSARACQTSA